MTGKKLEPISVEEYLAGEEISPVKHEYIAGYVYAMVSARNSHNQSASNALVTLGSRLRGKRCRAFNSDTKIRLRLQSGLRFYYPDASVICRPNSQSESFQDEPAVIIEVLSKRTRRIDEGEKKDAYFSISSLSVYLLVEQESPVVVAWRRTEGGFVRENYSGVDKTVPLREIDAELSLLELYDGVEFSQEDD